MKMRKSDNRAGRTIKTAGLLAAAAGAALGLGAPSADAGPRGEHVVRGRVTFDRQGDTTIIRASDRSIINYRSFDIGSQETVRFIQPGASARVLNRISGATPTTINGALLANGQVYIVNPSGVIFGRNATINAARLFAAGAEISNSDFIRGVNRFTNVTGEVINRGIVSAEHVHLIGSAVRNHGTIIADRGVVTMSVGEDVLIGERGDRYYVRLSSDSAAARGAELASNGGAGVENSGRIEARDGQVSLGAGDTLSLAVRNSGEIIASGGEVDVRSGAGLAHNSGSIDVSVSEGRAGSARLHGVETVQEGSLRADSGSGRAGEISVTSELSTTLADGSIISAAGGEGLARGGEILVHAFQGDTIMQTGALVDISGGTLGGDGGFAEISARDALGVHGRVLGTAALDYEPGSVLFDPLDIVIGIGGSDDGEVGDGSVGAGDSPGDTFFISSGAIESFVGDVLLEATQDIFITSSIFKPNGGLTLDAGRDLLFDPGKRGTDPSLIEIRARFVDFTAGRNIVDNQLTGTLVESLNGDLMFDAGQSITSFGAAARLFATNGDVSIVAAGGAANLASVRVDPGRTISWTQADDLAIGAGDFGIVQNGATTDFELTVTQGDLIFGGEFGGVSGPQTLGSVDGVASGNVRIEEGLTVNGPATLESTDADIVLSAFLTAGDDLSLTARNNIVTNGPSELRSVGGDINLTAHTGAIGINRATAETDNRFVRWTQAEDLIFSAGPFALIGNPGDTNVVIQVTDGSLTFGGEFAGVSGAQSMRSIDAEAAEFLLVDDDLTIATFADLRSSDDVLIDGFVHAGDTIDLHAALDGTGGLSFLSSGLSLWGDSIAMRAGNEAGIASATVDARTNAPAFAGADGGSTRPDSFTHQQDGAIPDSAIALESQFGAALGGSEPMSYLLQSSDASITIDDGSHFMGAALTLDSATGTAINDSIDVSNLLVRGPATLRDDVVADTTQTYEGEVALNSEITLSGETVTFDDIVAALQAGEASLTIDADASFGGAVGQGGALESLTVNGATTLLQGVVITIGDQRYNGAIALDADATLTSEDGGVIRFGGTIDGAHDLFVTTTEDGVIVFTSDVGVGEALRDIRLSTAGSDGVRSIAERATIVGEDSLQFRSRDFAMGQHEKFTTFGDLRIDATRDVILSDLVTTGAMRISAGDSITLLRRQPGDLLTNDGELVEDRGLDFVAGGVFAFEGEIVLGGDDSAPDPTFANTSAISETPALDPFELSAIDSDQVEDEALRFMDLALDQRSPLPDEPGPEPEPEPDDPSAELAGARDRDPLPETPVVPPVFNLQLMQQIAIDGRLPDAAEATGALAGRALYSNLPPQVDEFDNPYPIAAPRLDVSAVQQAVAAYNDVFADGEVDRTSEIARTISASVTRYFSLSDAAEFDPRAVRNYLQRTPEESRALAYVQDLQGVLEELRDVGLTPLEYRRVRNRILASVAPTGDVPVEQFAEMIELRPGSPETGAGGGATGAGL